MKSFYQFYESLSKIDFVYPVFFGRRQDQKKPIKVARVYEDEQDAIYDILGKSKNTINYLAAKFVGKQPLNGDLIYLLMLDNPNKNYYYLYNWATSDLNLAKIESTTKMGWMPHYNWKNTILQAPFVPKGIVPFPSSLSVTGSSPISSKSPYANLKHPLVGELTHYLSTQGLNQEIYHVMRDKSQKSINLINNLRTLIKKIELV